MSISRVDIPKSPSVRWKPPSCSLNGPLPLRGGQRRLTCGLPQAQTLRTISRHSRHGNAIPCQFASLRFPLKKGDPVRPKSQTCSTPILLPTLLLALAVLTPPSAADSGQELYSTSCAYCHGDNGEGVEDEFDHPLEGSLSVAQLAKLVGETMPADDPGSLSNDESQAVAAYIHDAFYSPVARERNRPARIDLARLTVRQYRQAIADLDRQLSPVGPVGRPAGAQR
jgi:cytochrome c553